MSHTDAAWSLGLNFFESFPKEYMRIRCSNISESRNRVLCNICVDIIADRYDTVLPTVESILSAGLKNVENVALAYNLLVSLEFLCGNFEACSRLF